MGCISNLNINNMRAVLNIGLNNNPLTYDQILEYLTKDFKVISHTEAKGSYNGEIEPTLVAVIDNPYSSLGGFITKIEQLASVLTQNCIAVSTDQFDLLCYAQGYKHERFKFNPNYFIS